MQSPPVSLIPVSGLQGWWNADAANLTCTGGCTGTNAVTAWTDLSSNANNLTLANFNNAVCGGGISTFVASAVNSKSGVLMDNGACYKFGTAINLQTASTIFVVMKHDAASNKGMLVSGDSGSLGYWTTDSSGKQQGADSVATAALGTGTATGNTSFHQMNMTYNGTTIAYRLDRATDIVVGASANAITANEGGIGNNGSNNNEAFFGTLCEVIIYNRVLSGGEITTVETYLNGRYGL